MRLPHVRWYIWLAPVIALVVGYATGHAPAAASNATMAVPGSGLTLEYPSDWRPAKPSAGISAFGLKQAVLLAPRGDASGGGLIAAAISDEGDPLPQDLLGRLAGSLGGQAISLVGAPAFRYQHLSMAGSDLGLTVYSIPIAPDRFTLAVCFAPQTRTSTRSTCEEIVESSPALEEGSTLPLELKPDAAYASGVSAALTAFATTRREVRAAMSRSPTAGAAMSRSPTAPELAHRALQLADTLAGAAAALTRLHTPPVAAHAASALERAMLRAQLSYEALASDAASGARSQFTRQRDRIDEAEAAIREAIDGFALLGYRVS